ncbi:hypothetical protein [Hymenobacter elongatus]|uniref:Ig-like domain-containing protein n=1 Tax=Hymenobacter elongatus TaxID=877208 RepID=A0A4Z0PQU7_9BACT|nr:hypothetical protein [Hymenobacter elongatus]TGE19686.1 hypothetical protein E5J99_02695 [Hymenobacter elongatus]
MKKLFTCCCAALLLGLSPLVPHLANAQPSGLSNTNGILLCPGKTYSFSTTSSPSTTDCAVNWVVNGGSTLLTNPTTAGLMRVSFNDVPGGSATVQTTYTGCNNTTANGQSPLLTVYIRSVTNRPLGTLTLNGSPSGNIEFGTTDQVTLEVPLLTIPRNSNEPNPIPLVAEGYEWTIPSGWRWPDGSISNGAPRLFTTSTMASPNRLLVVPSVNACGGSTAPTVRVRAVEYACGEPHSRPRRA